MPLLRPSALWQTRLRGSACSLARDQAMGGRHNGAASVSDLEDRLRILDALYIPTRYPDRLPDGAPTDDFGRLQSEDALRHARSIVDAIAAALARAGAGGETRRGRAS
ncbi:MAG: HEPN domain-containing protein [Synechococcaceae cyanobacterium]